LTLGACSSTSSGASPQLLIWESDQATIFSDAASGPGTVEVVDDCVVLDYESGGKALIAWPAPTRWLPDDDVVAFTSVWGDEVDLPVGSRVRFGGASTPYAPVSTFSTELNEQCEVDEIFIANSVTLLG
jgi:hypothetical protein